MKLCNLCLLFALSVMATWLPMQNLYGQESSTIDPQMAIEYIQENGIIVVLPSHQKTLESVEGLIDSVQLNKNKRRNAEKIMYKIKFERELREEKLVAALDELYTFSDYYLSYDYDLRDVEVGDSLPVIASSIKSQPSVVPLSENTILMLCRVNSMSNTSIEIWRIQDLSGKVIKDPFPNQIANRPVRGSFKYLFNKKKSKIAEYEDKYLDIAAKMNEKFHKYSEEF